MKLSKLTIIWFLCQGLFCISIPLLAQTLTKEYLTTYWKKTTSIDSAAYYREGRQNEKNEWEGEVKTYTLAHALKIVAYYHNGQLEGESVSYYANGQVATTSRWKEGKQTGLEQRWYENGQKKQEINWGEPQKSDYKVVAFWDSLGVQTLKDGNGELKRYIQGKLSSQEVYKNGTLVQGVAYGNDGNEYSYTYYEQMPEFPGGITEMNRYISKNVKYPAAALKNGISGKVFVAFVIGADGYVRDVFAQGQPLGYGIEEEAVRVVSQMPRWKPGIQDGRLVPVRFSMPITFGMQYFPRNKRK